MRAAIQQERRVEFNCEGVRFHDIRRWKLGEKYLGGKLYGMNMMVLKEAMMTVIQKLSIRELFIRAVPSTKECIYGPFRRLRWTSTPI